MHMRKALTFATTSLMAVSMALPVFAETATNVNAPTPLRDRMQNARERLSDTVCKRLEGRIDERSGRFDDTKEKHVANYRNLQDRLTKAMARWEARGYDVSALRADLPGLDAKIKQFAADYALFIAQLKKTRALPCGDSEGAFREGMKEARRLLTITHDDAKAIRDYYASEIKPDLEAIRAQTTTVVGNKDGNKERSTSTRGKNE